MTLSCNTTCNHWNCFHVHYTSNKKFSIDSLPKHFIKIQENIWNTRCQCSLKSTNVYTRVYNMLLLGNLIGPGIQDLWRGASSNSDSRSFKKSFREEKRVIRFWPPHRRYSCICSPELKEHIFITTHVYKCCGVNIV